MSACPGAWTPFLVEVIFHLGDFMAILDKIIIFTLFHLAKEGPNFKVEDEYNDETYYGFDACHEFVVNLSFEQVSRLRMLESSAKTFD